MCEKDRMGERMRKREKLCVYVFILLLASYLFVLFFFFFLLLSSVWLSLELVGLELMSTFGDAHSMHF